MWRRKLKDSDYNRRVVSVNIVSVLVLLHTEAEFVSLTEGDTR